MSFGLLFKGATLLTEKAHYDLHRSLLLEFLNYRFANWKISSFSSCNFKTIYLASTGNCAYVLTTCTILVSVIKLQYERSLVTATKGHFFLDLLHCSHPMCLSLQLHVMTTIETICPVITGLYAYVLNTCAISVTISQLGGRASLRPQRITPSPNNFPSTSITLHTLRSSHTLIQIAYMVRATLLPLFPSC